MSTEGEGSKAKLQPVLRQTHLQNLVDVFFEVEAENSVGLIQNQVLQRAQAEPLQPGGAPWAVASASRAGDHQLRCSHACDEPRRALVLVKWSVTRPGVPTMTCGRLAKEIACAMMSMPPTSVDVRMLMAAPSASNCAW